DRDVEPGRRAGRCALVVRAAAAARMGPVTPTAPQPDSPGLRSNVAVIRAPLYTDAACPWAYSASPALRVLEWRYGAQLAWRLVMIGLRDEPRTAPFDPARGTRR